MVPDEAQPARIAQLKGTLAPAARQRIAEFLGSFQTFEPRLGLLYGDLDGAVAGRPSWSLIAYSPQLAEELISMYAAFGAVVSYDLDGVSAIIPQIGHIDDLNAGALEFVGNRLCAAS